jgi:hypothetical protein
VPPQTTTSAHAAGDQAQGASAWEDRAVLEALLLLGAAIVIGQAREGGGSFPCP